jgi:hypothetical protein
MEDKIDTYDDLTNKIIQKTRALQTNHIKGDTELEAIYKNIIYQLDDVIRNVNKQRIYSPESDEIKVVKEWVSSNNVDTRDPINVLYFEFRAYCGMLQKLMISEEEFQKIIHTINSEKK